MNAMYFLVNTLFDLYLMVVILRIWLQLVRADFYNPFSQFIIKATHPIVGPMRRILPSAGALDTASIVLALVVASLKIVALASLSDALGSLNPINVFLTAGLVVIKEALSLAFWVLIIRAILSWVSQGASPMEHVLGQLTEPMLAPIRRIIPPMGGLDLSILVAIIALQFVQLMLQDMLGMV